MTEYRRYQGKSYMVWSGAVAAEGYEYPMLTQNRIFGLLPLRIANADEKLQFWYEISGRQALEDWIKLKKADCVLLKKLMTALAEAVVQAGEFLLCEDGISLLPEQIFVDAGERDISFCYMPFEKHCFWESLRTFMEYYLSHMDHGDREGAKKCYAVYERCQQAHVSMEELLEILYEDGEEGDEEAGTPQQELPAHRAAAKEADASKADAKPRPVNRFAEIWNKGKWSLLKQKAKRQNAYAYEPAEYPVSQENTTVFLGSETEQILGELRYEGEGSGTNLPIRSDVFVIGSRQGEVDGMIRDETISRIHARITKEEDSFYLEDMNSTNGTYRNGELLNYKEKVRLEKNDRITFAKVSYRFV